MVFSNESLENQPGWTIKTIGDICKIVGGSTPSRNVDRYWDGKIPWATPSDVTALDGFEIEHTSEYITKSGLESCAAVVLPAGSIMMTSRATIGYCAINQVPMATNQGFANLICGNEINDMFLLFWLKFFRPLLERMSSGSTFTELSKRSLSSIKIALPPLIEQKKIAEIVYSCEKIIQILGRGIELQYSLVESLGNILIQKGIGHSKFRNTVVGEIPLPWNLYFLEDIAKLKTERYMPNRVESLPYVGLEHIIAGQKWIEMIGKSDDTSSQKSIFSRGDVLFGKLRPYLRKVAIPHFDGVCSTDILVIRTLEKTTNEFLLWFLSSSRSINHAVSTSTGTRMPRTSWKSMKEILVPLPPIEEQIKITEILGQMSSLIQLESRIKELYNLLQKGLMQALLTGKVRVKV